MWFFLKKRKSEAKIIMVFTYSGRGKKHDCKL